MQDRQLVSEAQREVLDAFDQTLLVLGESVKDEIHLILERSYQIALDGGRLNLRMRRDWKSISDCFHNMFRERASTFEAFVIKQMETRLRLSIMESAEVNSSPDFTSAMRKMEGQIRERQNRS